MAKPSQVKPAETPVVTEAPVVVETPVVEAIAPVVTESAAVDSESQLVTDTAPFVTEPVVEAPALPAGVLMASPSISDNGVEPGTSVSLPDGTVITHN